MDERGTTKLELAILLLALIIVAGCTVLTFVGNAILQGR